MSRPPRTESKTEAALARLRAVAARSGDPAAIDALEELARHVDVRASRKAELLGRAAQVVNSSLDLRGVLGRALEIAVDAMRAERGFLVLRDGHRVAALRNLDRTFSDAHLEPPPAIVARALAGHDATFSRDARIDPRWKADPSVARIRSAACLPLRVRDDVLGALYLDSRVVPDLFTTADRETLAAFGYRLALAIENARLFDEERERLARISSLQQFQTRILEAIANGVVTLSPRREITTFNRAAETTFGLTSDAMTGRSAAALAAAIPEFPELLEVFFESGGVQLRAEVEAYRSDGTPLTLEMRLSPLENPEGKGVAMVVTDVTRQRRLEVAHEAQVEKTTRVEESFSRYLAPHIVKSLMDDPGSIEIGGERVRATMLFADIRGFTALAERAPAERVVQILNTYFERAVDIVFAHDGMLDKFYGDGLMAVFGTPRVRGDDAARAIAAAVALHDGVANLRDELDYALQISVGLATGEVVAGHFGSAMRMDYTVIGNAVNLASGLQSAAPPGATYCDQATIAAAGDLARPARRLAVRVKGRDEPVAAFEILRGATAAPLGHAT